MLRHVCTHLPRLTPNLSSRTIGISIQCNWTLTTGAESIRSIGRERIAQQFPRVTVRHCSSTATTKPPSSTSSGGEDKDMTSKYLETSHERIFDNNREWVKKMKEEDPEFFVKLGSGQNPEYLYIGCSDSRVPPNQIMGLGAGEVFTTRNIANLVPNTDLSVMSVINYAVRHLKVKHIVVCGHYGCGGVASAMTPADLGILNPWLRNIRDVYRLHETELDSITDSKKRYDRLVELNVVEQCRNVIKTAAVQQSYEKEGFPIVHGWVFDIHDGLLRDLDVDFENMLKGIKKLYNLGAVVEEKGDKEEDGEAEQDPGSEKRKRVG